MASTEGLVPITKAFLASYYDNYPFSPLSGDVSCLFDEIRSMARDLQTDHPLSEEENLLVREADSQPPHKIDENMWKNREQMEEILFLLERSHWPNVLKQQSTAKATELTSVLLRIEKKFESTLKILETFQSRNSEHVFNTVMTYMPQDFRGTLIRQQKERSERNKQAEVEALINSGGSIRERYALLWRQQMDRRRQLAQLGSATGVYKTLVKYLVGVPQVLLDFVRQINDDEGQKQLFSPYFERYVTARPMEEQRHRYGPPLYSLTKMVLNIRLFLSLLWEHFEESEIKGHQISILEEAVDVYTSEFERFIRFIGEVFTNSPFLITAEDAGTLEAGRNEQYKEISVPAGKTYEVSLVVETINSYIAWDFSLTQGKVTMDIGFSMEYIDPSGQKTPILPYRRYEADQGNFCTCMAGNYKLIWDNSYSTFFKKVVRYKVDCIPPVVEPASLPNRVEG